MPSEPGNGDATEAPETSDAERDIPLDVAPMGGLEVETKPGAPIPVGEP